MLKHFTLAMTSQHPGSLHNSYNSTRAQSHLGLPFWPGLCIRCANLLPAGLTSFTSWTHHPRECLAESFHAAGRTMGREDKACAELAISTNPADPKPVRQNCASQRAAPQDLRAHANCGAGSLSNLQEHPPSCLYSSFLSLSSTTP